MRLLIAADIFPPEAGGPATYAATLANEMVKRGIEVKVVSLNSNSDFSLISCPGYRVSAKNKVFRYLNYFLLLLKHAGKCDVVYSMGPVNAGLPGWLVARLRAKKFVVKVVGDYAWEQGVQRFGVVDNIDDFQQKLSDIVAVRRLQKIERFVVCHANAVITPSKYLGRMVQGWGANPEQVQVVYNAISIPAGIISAEKPSDERLVVSVARLVPWKGMEALMKAVKTLLGTFPNLKLKIIGDGPDRPRLENVRSELGLVNVVDFLGNVPRATVMSQITAADVLVLNSGYEGLSHTLLEARFLGRTAIASHMGGNPEVLPDNCLFTWDDVVALVSCLGAALKRPTESITPEFAKQFSFPTMISETKKLLEKVCAN